MTNTPLIDALIKLSEAMKIRKDFTDNHVIAGRHWVLYETFDKEILSHDRFLGRLDDEINTLEYEIITG